MVTAYGYKDHESSLILNSLPNVTIRSTLLRGSLLEVLMSPLQQRATQLCGMV